MKKYVVFLIIAFFSILQGCDNMDVETKGIPEFNAAVVKYPGLLDNRHIKGKRLDGWKDDCSDGVHWENLVIHNLTLENVEMWRAHLKNVTFVDCKFIKVDFSRSIFDNVKFIRGKIYGYSKPDQPRPSNDYESTFDAIYITRVLFDGTEFGQSVDMNFSDGIVVMRNIKADLPPKKNNWLLYGYDLQVRMDNCKVSNQAAVLLQGEKDTLYATNSRFINAELKLKGPAAWIENCELKSPTRLPQAATVVIKNSKLSGVGVGGQDNQRYFLVGNTFIRPADPDEPTVALLPTRENTTIDNTHLYLYADTEIPGRVGVDGGNIHIYGAKIGGLYMGHQNFGTHMASLNLQNVKIGQGKWKLADVRHGKWENVEIYPPVDLNGAKFGEIIGHRVEFPRGTPWKNGELKITNSSEPLTFDKPPVPTLEETGLAQFWKENDFPKENY